MGNREVIEHTADVGVRATATTITELFYEVSLGLLDITGRGPATPEDETVELELADAPDAAALLVDWLGEILYRQDARDRVITDVTIDSVEDLRVSGRLRMHQRAADESEGTPVKAVTYHQLVVEERDGVWTAQVFFDI